MPAASKAKPSFRVEFLVKAITSVEIEAASFEEALETARKNLAWATEGLSVEVCDKTVTIAGISDAKAWSVL
jgi:hypothetical protein